MNKPVLARRLKEARIRKGLTQEALGVLAVPIHYRGLHLHLRVSGKGVIISVDPRDAGAVEVECHGRVVALTPGTTARFPG